MRATPEGKFTANMDLNFGLFLTHSYHMASEDWFRNLAPFSTDLQHLSHLSFSLSLSLKRWLYSIVVWVSIWFLLVKLRSPGWSNWLLASGSLCGRLRTEISGLKESGSKETDQGVTQGYGRIDRDWCSANNPNDILNIT